MPPGQLPAAVGAINVNVATTIALNRAVETGMPVTHKVVTVSGSAIANPKNLAVLLGNADQRADPGLRRGEETPHEVMMGGPMMGVGQFSLDVPVIKGTNAILAFCGKENRFDEEQTCIRCGKCVSVCPMNLMPIYINMYARQGRLEECEKYRIMDCIECGCCSYICPGRLHLVQSFRTTKQTIAALKKKKGE